MIEFFLFHILIYVLIVYKYYPFFLKKRIIIYDDKKFLQHDNPNPAKASNNSFLFLATFFLFLYQWMMQQDHETIHQFPNSYCRNIHQQGTKAIIRKNKEIKTNHGHDIHSRKQENNETCITQNMAIVNELNHMALNMFSSAALVC